MDVNFYPHHNHHEVAAMKVELESETENTRGKVKPKQTVGSALNRKNSFCARYRTC